MLTHLEIICYHELHEVKLCHVNEFWPQIASKFIDHRAPTSYLPNKGW